MQQTRCNFSSLTFFRVEVTHVDLEGMSYLQSSLTFLAPLGDTTKTEPRTETIGVLGFVAAVKYLGIDHDVDISLAIDKRKCTDMEA